MIEIIRDEHQILAYLVRSEYIPDKTTFVTPEYFKQQLGYIVYPAGAKIARHRHIPIERSLIGTSEVIIVKKGRCEADIYDDQNQIVTTISLDVGDTLVIAAGGHGFRMIEDCVLMEVKQGPYTEQVEKEHF